MVIGNAIIVSGGGGGFTPADEGKVVSNGALVAQGSQTITQNGNYDTTLVSELIANISGGGSEVIEITQYANVSADSTIPSPISSHPQFTAEQALGDGADNWWGANGNGNHWWMIRLNSPKIITVVKFSNYWREGSYYWQSATIALQGSNDGSTWNDIEDFGILAVSNLQKTYTVINENAYLLYRFVCNSNASAYTGIGKIQLYEKVSGVGGSTNILGGTTVPTSTVGADGDIYIKYTDNNVPSGYTPIEYISSDGNQYIVTDIPDRTQLRTVVDVEVPTGGASDQTILGGVGGASSVIYLGFNFNSGYVGYYFNWTGSFLDVRGMADNSRHVIDVSLESGNIDIKKDGSSIFKATNTLSAVTASNNLYIFSRSNGNQKARAKLYGLQVYDYLDNGELIGHFVPVKRDSDDAIGMYDLVSDVFYTNSGTGTFTAGEEMDSNTPIDVVYLKVNGSWIIIEDGDWDDVNTGGE